MLCHAGETVKICCRGRTARSCVLSGTGEFVPVWCALPFGGQACRPQTFKISSRSVTHCAGETNGSWVVDLPAEEVPPELPEPCLGINFARDGMQRSDWLALVAVHSDAWLYSVAYFFGTKLEKEQR